jgi:H+/Na+-translocating ferredoxin:NAD+ oxidoreductase subunit B
MDKAYKELALVLDKTPNGYPPTASGVELEILAELFTPEEAALACHLGQEGQTAKTVAARAGIDERQTFTMLKTMLRKGLIEAERGDGGLSFVLIPFVVGFYENQNGQIDEKFAHLFEQYYQESLHKMMSVKPSVHRVIPIEETIPVNVEVMPYERASTFLQNAKAWGVLPCICRVQKKQVGDGCHHTIENCMVFSSKPNAFDRTDRIRAITKEESQQILKQAGEEGLVHSTNNVQDGVTYICNCCTCSCGILRGIAEFGHVNAVGSSDFLAVVDAELCTGCSLCVERCQFKALEIKDDLCVVDTPRCYGCGQCITVCPTEAIQLRQKETSQIQTPPVSEKQWQKVRSAAREEV